MISFEHNGRIYDFKVFDAHNHIGLDKQGLVGDSSYNDLKNAFENIDKTILFPSNALASGPFFIHPNMTILDIAQKSNGKIVPFYRFDIYEVKGCKYWQTGLCNGTHKCLVHNYFNIDCCSGFDLEKFFAEIKNLGFKGLKLHPRASEIKYKTPKLDSDMMQNIINAAGKVGFAVTIHTHNINMLMEFFKLSGKVLPYNERLVLICAHSGGGPTQLKRKMSREYAGKQLNKYLDRGEEWVDRMLFETSNVFWKYLLNGLLLCTDLKKTDKSIENIKNLIYGTDWPFVKNITPEEKVIETIESLFSAGFNEKEIGMIMSTNLESRINGL